MSYLSKYLEQVEKESQQASAIAFWASIDHVMSVHPGVAQGILDELHDQRSFLKLIASENYCSLATQQAMGNLLTDKYAEGIISRRFYAGCKNVDSVEAAAADELKSLFNCEHAYVQPHSGADANLVALWAILVNRVQNKELEKFDGQTLDQLSDEDHEFIRQKMVNQSVLGMSLNSGGHLTHGYRHNISSKFLRSYSYDVDPNTHLLDYDSLFTRAREVRPTILMAGYSAYPRKINFAKMREIADDVGAVLMVDMAHFSGLVAGKAFKGEFDPIPYAHIATSTTHKTLRGPRGGIVLCKEEFKDTVDKGCPLVLGGPLPHVMAAKAVAFKEANTPAFQKYAQRVLSNAQALSEALQSRGVPLITGGTDNHLLILDIQKFGITGRQGELALRDCGITVNRNTIPFDANGAWYTSGLRIGTPAMSTLGMGSAEMEKIADLLVTALEHTKPTIVAKTGKPSRAKSVTDESVRLSVKSQVEELLQQYPLYPELGLSL